MTIKNTLSKKNIVITLIIITTCSLFLVVLENRHIVNIFGRNSNRNDPKTTSETPTAKDDFNDGQYREPGNGMSEDKGNGGITDNSGLSENTTDTSNPISSPTGQITLYTPKVSSLVKTNSPVSGTSSLNTVNYRIIDSITGEISTGELKVINGRFSGTLSFNTNASDGRIDFFGTQPDGVEFSNLEIPVRFK